MSYNTDKLYQLLPAIYRMRDAERGEVLRAFISVLAEQAEIVEEDIARLYDNWFIETCDEWVVPYIGNLLGVRNLHPISEKAAFSQRARVANTRVIVVAKVRQQCSNNWHMIRQDGMQG